jgi:D-tyrosyl-tRNA(Tyr) deacylase
MTTCNPEGASAMRIVMQRVSRASVDLVGDPQKIERIASIGRGLLLLIGVGAEDVYQAEPAGTGVNRNPVPATEQDRLITKMADKIAGLRIFTDAEGKMNLNITQAGGSILAVSQFTLYADTSRGKRPGFSLAAPPQEAERIYRQLVERLRSLGIEVQTGQFGADMAVDLCNDGPVTIVIDEHP